MTDNYDYFSTLIRKSFNKRLGRTNEDLEIMDIDQTRSPINPYFNTTLPYTPPENPLTVLARINPNRLAGIMERKLQNERINMFVNQEIQEKKENTKMVQAYFNGMTSQEKGKITAYDVESFEVREDGILGFLGLGGTKKVTRVILQR